jgi:hypothetical protein
MQRAIGILIQRRKLHKIKTQNKSVHKHSIIVLYVISMYDWFKLNTYKQAREAKLLQNKSSFFKLFSVGLYSEMDFLRF